MTDLGQRTAKLARTQVGVSEAPPKSNCTIYGQWAESVGGKDGVEWCGNFASWCVAEASDGTRAVLEGAPIPEDDAGVYRETGLDTGTFGHGGVAYGCDHAPTIERWGRGRHKAKVLWIEPGLREFEPGDILCIAVPRRGEDPLTQHARHVAVFERYDDEGATIVAVAGNVGNSVQEQRWEADNETVLGGIRFIE